MWEDVWIGNTTLASKFPLLYRISNSKQAFIAELRQEENCIRPGHFYWDLKFNRSLNERELSQVSELILLLETANLSSAVAYRRIWKLDSTELFFSKITYNQLCLLEENGFNFLYSFFWKSVAPLKIRVFTQFLSLEKVNTCEVLQKHRPTLAFSPN